MDLKTLTEDFLSYCKRNKKVRPGTLADYAITMNSLVKWFGDYHDPRSIKLDDLEEWAGEQKISPSTQRKQLTHVRMLFRWAVVRERLPKNVAEHLSNPKVEASVTLPLTDAEVRLLMSSCKNKKLKALMALMLSTGLRISDAVALKRDAAKERLLLRTEKSGAPLWINLRPEVKELLAGVGGAGGRFFWDGVDLLKTCATYRKAMKRLGKRIGLDLHPHRLRDTFAVRLLRSGASIYTVQKLLGHSSVRTTERHYSPWVSELQASLDAATARLAPIG